ncbi:hypothetical protein FNF27_03700 [Cafeteria roenbergensis]|uniref:Nudix hydrolase domain-containing protein n=1 Tax=Cafeteria roenbergensis TaxID=33653 RepID=A0A5A8EA77_CAFRO|nr:hypothetical protein FNF27_03700 [Cafeteria roenbergensis]
MSAAARAAAAASPIAQRAALASSPKTLMLRMQPVSAEATPETLLAELQAIGNPCFESASVQLKPGFAVVSFGGSRCSSRAISAAVRSLRGRNILGEKIKAEWVLPPTLTFTRLEEAGLPVAEGTKAGGLVPLRRSASGGLEALLAVQDRKLAGWEKQRSLSADVLAILGGRRAPGESVIECVAREFFEETGGVLGPHGLAKLRAVLSDALDVGDGPDCFGAWLAPGKFVAIFVNEALIPPAAAAPGEDGGGAVGIKEAMDGASAEVQASLGAVFNETSVVQWVSVSDLLEAVRPPKSGPVHYGSPSKLGAVYATSVSGRKWRIGHFLTMALMEPAVRRRLAAMLAAPWGARA